MPGVRAELSTARLLTMDWLEGGKLLDFKQAGRSGTQSHRPCDVQGLVDSVQPLRRHPRRSAPWQLHGLRRRRKTVRRAASTFSIMAASGFSRRNSSAAWSISTRDCCTMISPAPSMPMKPGAFAASTKELAETLNIWARFIYAPLLDDRVRSVADGVAPAQYGRKEAFAVHQALKKRGPVLVPREFVFMDRAAIGLGSAFLHLDARLNFYQLFHETMGKFSATALERTAGRRPRRSGAASVRLEAARSFAHCVRMCLETLWKNLMRN